MNPALLLLMKAHAASRVRRLKRAFTSPRRLVLTLSAVGLGVVWLGQTIASVLIREPYRPEAFRSWTSLLILLYFTWHIVRVAYRRPDAAIDWSPAEAEQVVGGPFRRRDILMYRFIIILTSTLPKALLTAFVLIPDLWWSGLPGIVLALVFLECFRLAIDLAAWCVSERAYLIARTAVFSILLALAGLLFSVDLPRGTTAAPASRGQRLADAAHVLSAARHSRLVTVVERPFVVFADVITARSLSPALIVNGAVALLLVGGLLVIIVWLDRLHEALSQRRQRIICESSESGAGETAWGAAVARPLPWIPRLGAIGPLVWRQWRSAARYRGSLLVALAIPAALSCLPLFSVEDTTLAFLALSGAVVFYSFVLLPEALKFDFRLDCDHLTQLKMLPMAPSRVVLGQLAVPILIASVFQVTLFLIAGIVRPISPMLLGAGILLAFPINALFVAIDNLIFLLYPHRPTQEGFEAFVRTILKFTFKSLLLGVAGLILLGWALASRSLVDAGGIPHLVQPVFIAGITVAAWLAAAAAIACVTRAFDRYDVSFSVPT